MQRAAPPQQDGGAAFIGTRLLRLRPILRSKGEGHFAVILRETLIGQDGIGLKVDLLNIAISPRRKA